MRVLFAVLASGFVLSCGGEAPSASPTGPGLAGRPGIPQPPPKTFAVSGTVRDNDGVPLADAAVFVGCGGCKTGPGFSVATNAAGAYAGRLPAGTFDMFVRKPGYTAVSIYGGVAVTGDTTRDVTLTPGVVITGRTFEQGVGDLTGVRVEVLTGPDAGKADTTSPQGVPNVYSLAVLPGEFRLRATKDGYVPIDRQISAFADTHGVDFTMKWAYGSCLASVAPVFFDRYHSAGGEEAVAEENPFIREAPAPRERAERGQRGRGRGWGFRPGPPPAAAARARCRAGRACAPPSARRNCRSTDARRSSH